MIFKNILFGLGSAGVIGAGGYGIYSATRSSGEETKGNEVSETGSMNENSEGDSENISKTATATGKDEKEVQGNSAASSGGEGESPGSSSDSSAAGQEAGTTGGPSKKSR